jgi:hypothetical protein
MNNFMCWMALQIDYSQFIYGGHHDDDDSADSFTLPTTAAAAASLKNV